MDNRARLQDLYTKLEQAAQQRQLPLAHQASDIVPGEGNPDSGILLIGEAPGYHESVQHRPFVGRSGQLLRQTLAAMELADQVYISNIVKVRPPDNRDPLPAEIAAFKPWLDQEIQIIQPQLIVTLGRFSMAKFLVDVKISQVHGRLHRVKWHDTTLFILPMFHPAAALRQDKMKQAFLEDFKKVPKIMTWISDQKDLSQFESEVKNILL